MKRTAIAILLIFAMLFSLTVPALAARNGITPASGHEILTKLPATLQKPARPTTLEQAEGRADERRISVRLQEEKKQVYIEQYGDWYNTQAELDEAVAEQFSGGSYPVRWTLTQSKESVFQEIVKLTDSLTAGKTTDTEKAKAIFDWVSQNVDYDFAAYQYYVWQERGYRLTKEQQQRLNEVSNCFYVYAKKQAVCSGYANLCWLMLSIAEIPAACISGNSNDAAIGGSGPHAWNTVLLDGKWLFFDATWDMWDMAPNYHNTSNSIIFCNGVFQQSVYLDTLDGSFPVSYWLCPGYECPANVVMPEGCWDVMAESFKDCTTLKSITLPSTCTIIQTEAFKGCTGLTSITIPANVTQVNWRAFQSCTSLKSVTFQNKSVDVWEDAFDGTPLVEDAKEFAIVDGVLVKYKGNDREVTIPSGVTAIAEKAFNCSDHAKFYIKKVVIPEGVISIGRNAFSNCRVLTDVTIPKSVTDIGGSAFSGTPWLTNQGDWPVFSGILLTYQGEDMESLTVPDGVREISDYAFYYNGKKTRSITFPASLKKIGKWAFNHSYLEEVNFAGTKEQWEAVEIVPDGGTNWKFRDEETTVHYNVALPTSTLTVPSANTAYASTQTVNLDGKNVTFECYALKNATGNMTNYIKLRDLALLLNGTAAQFEVGWDGSVTITTKAAYTPNGTEQKTPFSGDRTYKENTAPTKVNGEAADLAAFVLTDDAGGGYTYYQLRDLGKAIGFNVGWSADKGIFLETDTPYDPNN